MKVRKKMKAFIKKIFSRENLGSIAFFSVLLATLGILGVSSWMVLGKQFASLFFMDKYAEPWELFFPWFRWSFILLGSASFILNLWFGIKDLSIKPRIFYGSIFLFCTGIATVMILTFPSLQLFFWYIAFMLILPLFFFYANWKWMIPCVLCCAAAIWGWYEYILFLKSFFDYWNLSSDNIVPCNIVLIECANVFLIAGLLLQGKIYATAAGKRYKEIFTGPVWTIILLYAVTWGAALVFAHTADADAKKEISCWERTSPIAARPEKLKAAYYDHGKIVPNAEFWENFAELRNMCYPLPWVANWELFHRTPHGVLPEKEFGEWQQFFHSSQDIKDLQKLFASDIPFPVYNFPRSPRKIAEFKEGDLSIFFCNMQLWELNFALKSKNFSAAVKVLDRWENFKQFLYANKFSIYSFLTLAEVEFRKSFALEKLLASGAMNTQTIRKQLQVIAADKKFFASAEKQMVENHGAMLLYFLNQNEYNFPNLIFPAFRHLYSTLRGTAALSYRTDTFDLARKRMEKLEKKNIFPALLPGKDWSTKFQRTFTRLLVFETFLKLELEKQAKGSYPAQAPSWLPPDPFTGRQLHYCKGEVFISEPVFDSKSGSYKLVPDIVDAVAIWSAGEDGLNCCGLGRHERDFYDDIRAMIRL